MSQGRRCNRFLTKSLVCLLFIGVKRLTNIKMSFPRGDLFRRAAEIATNITKQFYKDILHVIKETGLIVTGHRVGTIMHAILVISLIFYVTISLAHPVHYSLFTSVSKDITHKKHRNVSKRKQSQIFTGILRARVCVFKLSLSFSNAQCLTKPNSLLNIYCLSLN